MSITKGIGFLVLFYLLISGSVVWRVRQICLIQRDECGYFDLLDTVFSSRLITIASAMFVGLMVFVTAHVISRLRDNTLGIEQEEPPRRQFNVNGNLVALIVFALYLGGSLVVLTSAAGNSMPLHEDKFESFIWTTALVAQGPLILPLVLWHLNDYLVNPASKILLFLLPCITIVPVFWVVRAAFLTIWKLAGITSLKGCFWPKAATRQVVYSTAGNDPKPTSGLSQYCCSRMSPLFSVELRHGNVF